MTTTATARVRNAWIISKGAMDTERQTGRPAMVTHWQWAIAAEVDGRVSGTVAYNNGSGWMHFATFSLDSVQAFNDHVDGFIRGAVKVGSKITDASGC